MKNQVVLIITSRCNFRCKHCLREYYSNQDDLSFLIVKKTIKEVKELGIKHVALTGGEPILYPHFEKLIDLIAKYDLTWSIVSNGSLFKKYEHIVEKHKDKLKFISLSLDGGTEATHDYIRQKGSFQKVVEAAKYYLEKGIFVRLAYTVNSKNIQEIQKFVELAVNLKVNSIKFGGIIPTRYNKDLHLEWAQKVAVFKYLQELKKKLTIPVDHATSLFTYTNEEKFCANLDDHEPTINSRGDYIFCCDTVGQGAVIGSLKKNSFSNLYLKGVKMATKLKEERKRRILKKLFFKDFNSCHFCNFVLERKIKHPK